MQSKAATPDEYISEIPESQREAFIQLRKTVKENLPEGYEEEMSYGMIGYVVPFSIYPKGYNVKPKVPLPLLNLAAQKTSLPFTTRASMPISNCWNGSPKNIPSTAN